MVLGWGLTPKYIQKNNIGVFPVYSFIFDSLCLNGFQYFGRPRLGHKLRPR